MPHESPQSIELPCIIDNEDGGTHPIELGSEVSHEPVDEIKGLLIYEINVQNTRGFEDTYSCVDICAGEIDYQNELKRYVLFVS